MSPDHNTAACSGHDDDVNVSQQLWRAVAGVHVATSGPGMTSCARVAAVAVVQLAAKIQT